jgi:cellulose 1,4-beta-cellobiosidase
VYTRPNRITAVAASLVLVVTAFAVARAPVAQADATTRVLNPWFGAVGFVNPGYATEVQPFIDSMTAAGNTTMATAASSVSKESTAIWLDSKDAVLGTPTRTGLAGLLDQAVIQQGKDPNKAPVVVTIVLYDLPGRDCGSTGSASGDWIPTTAAQDTTDEAAYESGYITPIVTVLSAKTRNGVDSGYEYLRFAIVLEPDALPNVVSNSTVPACAIAVPGYEKGIEYALSDIKNGVPNAYNFLDVSNSGWLSWNTSGAATEYNKVVLAAGAMVQPPTTYSVIDGFMTNTSNYYPVQEPYFKNQQVVGTGTVNTASYYGGQHDVDELSFINDSTYGIRSAFSTVGFPASVLNFAIDTSRNGWGGSSRPAFASVSTDLNTFVDQSRIDRRIAPSDWCNQSGAGIGEPPHGISSTPGSVVGDLANIDAFVWVKTPGESDGSSTPGTTGYDKMCDPTQTDVNRLTVLTGALPNAPKAGVFNDAQFAQLLTNAYPSVGANGGQPTGSPSATPNPPGGTCTAQYSVGSTWTNGGSYNGFLATVTVTNTGTTPIDAWQVAWNWQGNQSVQNSWNVMLKQATPNAITATNLGYNGILAAGASTTFGFVASFTGTNDQPTPVCTATAQSGSAATTAKCAATYTVNNAWTGGFQAFIQVNNTGDVPLKSWTVTWTWANGQKVTNSWMATVTSSGTSLSAVGLLYGNTVPVGGFGSFGLTGTVTGSTNTVTGLSCSAT